MALIADDPAAAAQSFLRLAPAKMTEADVLTMLRDPDTSFSATLNGVTRYAEFMHRVGSVKVEPERWSDLFMPALASRPGS